MYLFMYDNMPMFNISVFFLLTIFRVMLACDIKIIFI